MDEQRPQDVQPEWQALQKPEDPAPPPPGAKRLYRSGDQKLFLGICGGLGEYFDIDPNIVRLIFVIGILIGGTSIAIYAVLALIMPSEASLYADPRTAAQNTINEASDEVRKGIDMVVTRVKEMTGRGSQDQTPGTGAGTGTGPDTGP